MANSGDRQRGSASVEQVGLAALIATVLVAAIAAVAGGGEIDEGRALGGFLARRIACAPRLPDACRHHPLGPAYGWAPGGTASPPPPSPPFRRPSGPLGRAPGPRRGGEGGGHGPAPRPGRLPPLPQRELRR